MLRPSAGHSSFILCALFFLSVVPLCLPDLSSAGRSKSRAILRAQPGSSKAYLSAPLPLNGNSLVAISTAPTLRSTTSWSTPGSLALPLPIHHPRNRPHGRPDGQDRPSMSSQWPMPDVHVRSLSRSRRLRNHLQHLYRPRFRRLPPDSPEISWPTRLRPDSRTP